jgi:hypothetical protein
MDGYTFKCCLPARRWPFRTFDPLPQPWCDSSSTLRSYAAREGCVRQVLTPGQNIVSVLWVEHTVSSLVVVLLNGCAGNNRDRGCQRACAAVMSGGWGCVVGRRGPLQ